jgi:hypothetical protein
MTQVTAQAPIDESISQGKPSVQVSAPDAVATRIQPAMDAPKKVPFQPVLLPHNAEKESPALDSMHLNFNLSSIMSYYPLLRAGGYMAEASTSFINNKLQDRHDSMDMNLKPKGLVEKYISSRVAKNSLKPDFISPIIKTEAIGFTGLALAFAGTEYKQLRDNVSLAVGAEMGKDASKVGLSDMADSKNPIISTAVDRYMWQSAARAGQGVSFAGGLFSGIVGSSALITLERTVFYRPTAYDILTKAVNDVQINRLGDEAKPQLVNGLIRAMQASRIDQRRPLLSKEQVDGLRPVLDQVAKDVINENFGIRGVIYIMGGGVLVPDNPELSKSNYEHVFKVGVQGVIEEGKQIREMTGAPRDKTWQTGIEVAPAIPREGYVAESAQEKELLAAHRKIQARGAMYSDHYRNGMRGGDVSGVGLS